METKTLVDIWFVFRIWEPDLFFLLYFWKTIMWDTSQFKK